MFSSLKATGYNFKKAISKPKRGVFGEVKIKPTP